MARARMLKPSFFTNEALSALPSSARLLFCGLWTIGDREGRLEDRPSRIKVELLPYDRVNADALLQKLHDAGFIVRYESEGNKYIQIINFTKHQNVHPNEAASTIPEPQLDPPQPQFEPSKSARTDPLRDRAELNRKSGSAIGGPGAESEAKSGPESSNVTSVRVKGDSAQARITSTSTSLARSSDPSDRAPSVPSVCREAFFRGRKPNAWVAAVIDLWQVPLSKEQREHLGGMLKRRRHGQKVWDAAEASKGAADPVQFMERILSDGKRERPTGDTSRTEKEPQASPFEGLGRTQTSGGETEGDGAGGGP